MAEELQYSTGNDAKRKYDGESSPPPPLSGRRTTGFSSRSPDAGGPVAPDAEIQAAKQKAQEIAARLFENSNVDAKRTKVENGGGYDSSETRGFSSVPPDYGHKPSMNAVASMPSSYGSYPGPSKKIEIPNGRVGVIIGKGGETIKYLQLQSGAKIQVTRDMDADPNSPNRGVELTGTPDQIAKAEQLIRDVLNEAESGGSGIVSRRLPGQLGGAEQYTQMIPNNKVGLIIGKKGETIKNMQSSTGARIQVIPLHLPPGDPATERTLQIDGTPEQIEAAKLMVNEVISENHIRNPSMSGYSQQGYQARAPTSWAPSGQQQPGYGYVQPGAYAGQAPQYNASQTQYPGYPQQPSSGGYAAGWDQTSAATTQQTTQVGGYDYYGQQSAPQQQAPGGAPGSTDNTGYGYQQPSAAGYSQQGQGYSQDAYGGYASAPQSGYGQPQPGYDQQHGYSSTTGYGNVPNPTTEGQNASYGAQGDNNSAPPSTAVGQQGYNASQQPSPNPSYPPSAQPGYGVPPNSQAGYGTQPSAGYGPSYGAPQAQKPVSGQPAYGQPQQSPTAQGGYAQPAPVQPGYSQPPSGYGTAPASGYAAAPPPYGAAPPATQPGYGGQQPPYNSSYASGYSQPPVYSADGNAAPASQTVPPNAAAKASPQS